MAPIEFRTLGQLDLRGSDGRELHSLLAQPKRIALLTYLCVATPRGFHRRDTLLGLLWPDADQSHARTSLRNALHILRRSLGDAALKSRGDEEVAVNIEAVWCDTCAFDDDILNSRFDKALDLYRGDVLPGFFLEDVPAFERWLDTERSKRRLAAARGAHLLAERYEAEGNVAVAEKWVRRVVELTGGDEREVRRLVELLDRAGDRAGALKAYEEFSKHLGKEYGVSPSPETVKLAERLRGSAQTPTRTVAPQRPSEPWPAPMPRNLNSDAPWLTDSNGPSSALAANSEIGVRSSPTNGIWTALKRIRLPHSRRAGLALLGLTAAAAFLTVGSLVSKGPARSRSATSILPPENGRFLVDRGFALSPDGSKLAFVANSPTGDQKLWVRDLNEGVARELDGTSTAETPFWSPDGRSIGFFAGQELRSVGVDGGPVVSICESARARGGSWNTNDTIVFAPDFFGPLFRVPASGGKPTPITRVDSLEGHLWPVFLADGHNLLYTRETTPVKRETWILDLRDMKSQKLMDNAWGAVYAAGHIVYLNKKDVFAVKFDAARMRFSGRPFPLKVSTSTPGAFPGLSVASSSLVFFRGSFGLTPYGRRDPGYHWVDRTGRELKRLSDEPPTWTFRLSPDGEKLGRAGWDLYVQDLKRGTQIPLTNDRAENQSPVWSPTGRMIIYRRPGQMLIQEADGSGPPKGGVLTSYPLNGRPASWSPDGQSVLYDTRRGLKLEIWTLSIRSGKAAQLLAGTGNYSDVAFSPDGKWIAYQSDETGAPEVFIRDYQLNGPLMRVSPAGGRFPAWRRDGKELFYLAPGGILSSVAISETGNRIEIGTPRALFHIESPEMLRGAVSPFDVFPDGKQFLVAIASSSLTNRSLGMIQNWMLPSNSP